MTNNYPLRVELNRHIQLKDRLTTEFPDTDEDTLCDTLEGITNLPEMIAQVVRSALDDEAMLSGLKTRMGDMKVRLDRIEARAQRKRSLVTEVMVEADIKKLMQPDMTVSLRSSQPSLVVVSESDIPDSYWKAQSPRLDKQSILAGLKHGQEIPGACLGNARFGITVRTK